MSTAAPKTAELLWAGPRRNFALSSAEASLCCREAGEKEARASYFPIIAIFTVIPSGSLCGGEREL